MLGVFYLGTFVWGPLFEDFWLGSFGGCLLEGVFWWGSFGQNQGGSRQNNIGWALCSNDDVIMLMTSLLLFNPAKHWVGRGPPARYLPD